MGYSFTEPKLSKEEAQLEKTRQVWADREWTVLTLEGHNDLVSAVHLDRDCLLSGRLVYM